MKIMITSTVQLCESAVEVHTVNQFDLHEAQNIEIRLQQVNREAQQVRRMKKE